MPRRFFWRGFIRSTTSASNPAEASRTKRRSFAFAIRTEIVFPEESRSRHPSTDSGRENSRAKTFPVPWGTKARRVALPANPSATSFIVPSPPTATTASAPSSAASRAITTASPGAAVSRIRKGRPRADRYDRTRSIRFTTLGPATGL